MRRLPYIDILTPVAHNNRPFALSVASVYAQKDVLVKHYVVAGTPPQPHEPNRLHTIARARNELKEYGNAPWIFWMDSDIVIPKGALARMVARMKAEPQLGAVCLHFTENIPKSDRSHFGMGAVLISRELQERVVFRADGDRCECSCFAEDIRSMGLGIDYMEEIDARHLRPEIEVWLPRTPEPEEESAPPSVGEGAGE